MTIFFGIKCQQMDVILCLYSYSWTQIIFLHPKCEIIFGMYKRYFKIDLQIGRHFVHCSECLYHLLFLSMQLKLLTLCFLLQGSPSITINGWDFLSIKEYLYSLCSSSVESLMYVSTSFLLSSKVIDLDIFL